MLKMRLSMGGTKKRPVYKIVVADSRFPRDGRFIEKLGFFNPLLPKDKKERVGLDIERIKYWLGQGARPTIRVARILGENEIMPMPAKGNNPQKAIPKKDRNNLTEATDPYALFPADKVGRVHYGQQFQTCREYEKEGWPDLVVCMWSGINRLENLRLSNLTGDWSWCVSAWNSMGLELPTYKAKRTSTIYIDQQYEPGEDNYMRGYMMRIRNAHYNLRLTMGNMMAVKYMLKAKGIPQLHYLYSSGQYQPLLFLLDEPLYENTNNWWDSLDIDRKTAVEELPWLESEGMYDMAERLELPIGERDHPLEEAHAAMAQRILGDIEKHGLLT